MVVEVPAEVFEGLERVRREGRTNMLDRVMVQRLAHENGDHATVIWLEDHAGLYARGVFEGFEPVDDEEGDAEMTTETMYREVGIRPAPGGGGEWEVVDEDGPIHMGVEDLREVLYEGGAEGVYDLGVDEIPDSLGGERADICGLVRDEPARILLAVYREDGRTVLQYTGLERVDGEQG